MITVNLNRELGDPRLDQTKNSHIEFNKTMAEKMKVLTQQKPIVVSI